MLSKRSSIIAVALVALLGAVGCSSGDDDATTTTEADRTSTTVDESAATVRFDKEIQQELWNVGCYTGEVDGLIGPQTDAAILAFQTAADIEADGELGPETEAALEAAVDDGKKICDESATTTTSAETTTTAASGGTAPCTAAALLGGLPDEGEHIGSFICAGGYAAGTLSDGTTKFILEADSGKWVATPGDPCGSASAGLPPEILADGC